MQEQNLKGALRISGTVQGRRGAGEADLAGTLEGSVGLARGWTLFFNLEKSLEGFRKKSMFF